jgi:hypothetical protein
MSKILDTITVAINILMIQVKIVVLTLITPWAEGTTITIRPEFRLTQDTFLKGLSELENGNYFTEPFDVAAFI